MVIVDWTEDYFTAAIVFGFLTLLCLSVLIYLIIEAVKLIKKRNFSAELILLFLIIAVILIMAGFLSYRTITLAKFNVVFWSDNYEVVSGEFEINSITRDDYRDSELYDIEFTINEMHFINTYGFSFEEKEKLIKNSNANIEVRYHYIGKEVFIYQILLLS